ncbi:hypothetical protein [Paenibacillus campi]|uniref:hypothetical protein n=1 Tax=Paenibacillus campi TaxID=3106031 RepID=UPI002AFFCC34|nr:hypothetical protein [Paenibacillus sp. SGZ-1014]
MGFWGKQKGLWIAGILLTGTCYQAGTAAALSYSGDVVPTLTADTGSNGAATASVEQTGHEAWRAFDDTTDPGSYWQAAADGSTAQIGYEFNDKKVITRYTVQADTYDPANAPQDWVFAGKLGNKWLALDEQSAQTDWTPGERKTFEITNDEAYSGYALFISSNNGGDWITVDDLELQQYQNNYNLVPPTATGGTASASVHADTAWKAFDHSLAADSAWTSDSQRYVDASLSYTFQQPTVIKGYSISAASPATAPVSWALVGSNDGEQWSEVVHEVPSSIRWDAGVTKTYAVNNDKAYKTYKLIMNRNTGPAQVSVSELELY